MYFDREEKGSTERICNEVAESSLCSPARPKALTVFSCQREERSKVPGLILRQRSGKMIKYKKDKRRKKIMTERISNVLRATNSNASPSVHVRQRRHARFRLIRRKDDRFDILPSFFLAEGRCRLLFRHTSAEQRRTLAVRTTNTTPASDRPAAPREVN